MYSERQDKDIEEFVLFICVTLVTCLAAYALLKGPPIDGPLL